MVSWFIDIPGRIYVLATLLPLAVFALALLGGLIRVLARPYRVGNQTAAFLYYLFGGDKPLKAGAYLATGAMALAAFLAIYGLTTFLSDAGNNNLSRDDLNKRW